MLAKLRIRSLPRVAFHLVAALVGRLLTLRPVVKLIDSASKARWIDAAGRAAWPTEEEDYPASLRLLQLARRPRLVLALFCYLLAARRDGVLITGEIGGTSFGEQSPDVYKRHRTAFMRRFRFLRECVLPTVFVKRCDWAEVHGYMAEGYEIGVWYWLEGKARHYVAGRRGDLLYEPQPPVEEGPPDWFMPDAPTATCPACGGCGMVGELDGMAFVVTRETTKAALEAGVELYDCDDCDDCGEIEGETDEDSFEFA